jgi:hypothetical protein
MVINGCGQPYEEYLNRVHEDNETKFLYEVFYIYNDSVSKKVVTIVRPLDTAPKAKEERLILMDGTYGVIKLVRA